MILAFFVILLFGAVEGITRNIDLLTFASGPKAGYQINGAVAGETIRASAGGDFNGDGLKDVIVNAHNSDYGGKVNRGVVYLIFGSRAFNTTALDLLNFRSGSAGIRVFGAAANDNSGVYNDGGGDINADGYDDVLIGSYSADPDGVADAGTVWVLFGHSAALPFVDIDLASVPSSYGFRIRGEAAGDWMGGCAFLGDMNGDGYGDIIVSAQSADPVSNNEGKVYIIFGKSSFSNINPATYTFGTNQGFTFSGSVSAGQLGRYLGTMGDFNGDGYADAILSYAVTGTSPVSYVLFGHSNATDFPNILEANWATSSSVGFKITGPAYTLRPFGSPGDVNGDGVDDFMLTGPGTGNYGYTYVLFGQRTGSFADITLPGYLTSSTGFSITGVSAGDYAYGTFIGDVNMDGYADIGVASPYADAQGRTDAGQGYVLYGHSSATVFSAVALSGFTTSDTRGYTIAGALAGDGAQSGFPHIARLGDVNGDGVDDVAYTSYYGDALGRADCGVAYILLSDNRYPTSQPSSQPSRQPSLQPSAQPFGQPSAKPSSQPSCQPLSSPSAQPTSQPSIDPIALQTILASPTYKVRNGFAFAVVTANGKALSWGEAVYGGDSSAVQSALQSSVTGIVGARFAFAAIRTDYSLHLWGSNETISGPAAFRDGTYQLSALIANEAAFAGVDTQTGKVIAVGAKHHGGDVLDDAYCNGYSAQLSAGVRSITASAGAFAAIKTDGTVLAWGSKYAGAGVTSGFLATLAGAKEVVASGAAFAVLLANNRVAAWGDPLLGGDTSAVVDQLQEVRHITASRSCFAAFKKDSSLVVWGYHKFGGDTSTVTAALSDNVVYVAHTFTAMAAVRTDGSVVAWGDSQAGGDASAVQSDLVGIVKVYGSGKAFAALTSVGGVVAWGRASQGGSIPAGKQAALTSGVVSIYHTDRAFAALKSTGQLVVWGQAGHGGEPSAAVEALLTSGVHTVCTNDMAFSAIKTDGSVVVWGHSTSAAVQGVLFTSTSLTQPATCA
jgi:hypothetical protein